MNQEVEHVNPYRQGDKTEQVEEMFDSIAPAYDFMNAAMTFGLFKSWRNKALARAHKFAPEAKDILDIATGTGDVALHLLKLYPNAAISGLDLSEGMLKIAREKAQKLGVADRCTFTQGDSLQLPYGDNSFDLITVAYGIRNFADISRGLSEMARVLRPDGTLCILELSEPANPVLRTLYRFYSHNTIPMVGRMVSGDKSAYSYLPQSVAACPQRDGMTRLMTEAGFHDCLWKSLTFGAATIYLGKKRL